MYNHQQYTSDLEFIEKIDMLLSRKIGFLAYFFALAACLAAHTLYLIIFAIAEVRAMVIFNIFSVCFYAMTIFAAKKVKSMQALVYAALAEIILHAAAATVCVGLRPDFCMFLLMIIPLAFLMPNKNKKAPFAVMMVSVPLYGFLRYIYRDSGSAVYSLDGSSFLTVFYIINILVGSFVLAYVATIFTIMNRYTDCVLRVQNEQLRVMASTDPLTKLSNRREINRRLREICESREGEGYILAIGDLDDFKRVNDTYGHDVGDSVLSSVAGLITDNLPKGGCASRWGGEEFLFVIPGLSLEDGIVCADGIISAVREKEFYFEGNAFFVTMTIGLCAAVPEDNIDKVISLADSRLYKGKRNGKNHTEYTD